MAKEGRQLVKEAVQDAESLKEMAISSAKNQIVEALAPELKKLLRQTMKESVDRYSGSSSDYYASDKERKYEEGKEKGDQPMDDMKKDDQKDPMEGLDLEALAAFFPALSEKGEEPDMEAQPHAAQDGDEEKPEEEGLAAGIPTLGEGEEEPEMKDEAIEISEAELQKVYEAALQMEVQVKKGFSDMSKSGELDEVDPNAGLADVKKGEHSWEKETPPSKQKWIPEQVQNLIRQGIAENKRLAKENAELKKMVKEACDKLVEVNLFNSKVLHVNRLLNSHGKLTSEQKKIAIESLDKAGSIDEVKTIYEAIDKTFKTVSNLSEGSNPRKPTANAQRARTSGAPKTEVLRESVDKGNSAGNDRWKRLAGLVK